MWAGGGEPHRPAREAHIAPSPGRLQKAAGGESAESVVAERVGGGKRLHSQIIILAKLLEKRHPRPLLHPLQSPGVSGVPTPRSACCKLCFLRRAVCNRTSPLRGLRRRAGALQVQGSRQGLAITNPSPVPSCRSASLPPFGAVGCAPRRGLLAGGTGGGAPRFLADAGLPRCQRHSGGTGVLLKLLWGTHAAFVAPGPFVNP